MIARTNEHRADAAALAVLAYARATRYRSYEAHAVASGEPAYRGAVEEQMTDLVCDLLHLCDRWEINPAAWSNTVVSSDHYDVECNENHPDGGPKAARLSDRD